jgi:cadmium resistance protein CadD (predicted permease)
MTNGTSEHAMTSERPTTSTVIAWSLLATLFIVVVLLFFIVVPKGNESTLNIVLGAIIGSMSTIVAFYFGDSKKSQQQADTINTLANKSTP